MRAAAGDRRGVSADPTVQRLSDLMSMARERSIVTAILIAGDADLVEAVSQAQHHGVGVIVWGVQTPKSTMSPNLRREADRVRWLTADQLAPYFTPVPKHEPIPMQVAGHGSNVVAAGGANRPRSRFGRDRRTCGRADAASVPSIDG